ncbi:unnamed protein product [Victoria cruziana]
MIRQNCPDIRSGAVRRMLSELRNSPFLRASVVHPQVPSSSAPSATGTKKSNAAVIAVAVLIPSPVLCILIFGLIL